MRSEHKPSKGGRRGTIRATSFMRYYFELSDLRKGVWRLPSEQQVFTDRCILDAMRNLASRAKFDSE